MREASRQLAFDLPARSRFGRRDFMVGVSNEAALRVVEAWPAWPDRLLHLAGPPGSGKTHLAAIWAARADATIVEAGSVALPNVPALLAAGPIVIEDVDRATIDAAALFHLVHGAREGGSHLLFTSAGRLDPAQVRLPDLLSRLRLAPRAALAAPDDALLRALMMKLFADRQLVVDSNVVEYLSRRIERSFARASEVVAELDAEALSRGCRITRAVAADVLGLRDEVTDEDGDLSS